MHMHEHPFWHVVHNERNRLDACYDQNAKLHPHAYAFQLEFVCRLLEEEHRACYVKLGGATV